MKVRPLFAAVAMAAAGAVLVGAAPNLTARAASAGPDAQAWWYVGNIGYGTPTPPPPPGVAATDLVVQGAKGDQTLPSGSSIPAPVPAPPPPPANPFTDVGNQGSATAIAALRFTIPSGAAVARLTLRYHGSPPPSGPQVAACRIPGATFTVEQEGPFADVPTYDCTVPSIGSLGPDGTSLVFSDIGALASRGTLAVVLVPIYPDQEVFAHPAADALTFRPAPPAFDGGSSATGAGSGAPAPGAAIGGAPPPAEFGAGVGGGSPAVAPAVSSPAGAPGAATSPGSTGAKVPSVLAHGTAAAAPAVPVDDTRARVIAAVALLAAICGFAAPLLDRPRLRLLLGGRPTLTAADPPQQTTGGLGRFARPRTGNPHSL